MSASVRRNRARGYCMAPMEAGMGMSCWILLVFVIVKPVEGKVSFWDHQTPGGNHAWGSNGEGLRAFGALGKGPCASGRFRRHLDGFRHFTVHMDHNEVYIRVCDAKLRPWCNMYLMRSRRDLACIIMARRRPGSTLSQGEIVMRSHEIQGGTEISVRPHRRRNMLYFGSDAPSNVANRPGGRPERSDMCDPSTSIFIHLRVALSGRCHNQLRPDSSWVWKEMLYWLC